MTFRPPSNDLPPHIQFAHGFIDGLRVRFEGAPRGMFRGDVKWAVVKDVEHATLCRAFGLDQASFSFDLPSSMRGIGANQQGHGSAASAKIQSGFVFIGPPGKSPPVAKLLVCRPGELPSDTDPMSQRDFEDLSKY